MCAPCRAQQRGEGGRGGAGVVRAWASQSIYDTVMCTCKSTPQGRCLLAASEHKRKYIIDAGLWVCVSVCECVYLCSGAHETIYNSRAIDATHTHRQGTRALWLMLRILYSVRACIWSIARSRTQQKSQHKLCGYYILAYDAYTHSTHTHTQMWL